MNHFSAQPRKSLEHESQLGESSSNSTSIGTTSSSIDLRNELLTPDYSVFSSAFGGDVYEPIQIVTPRNPQQQAALQSMLKESVEFLFDGKSRSQPANQAPLQHKTESSSLFGVGQQSETRMDKIKSACPDPDKSSKKRKRDPNFPSESPPISIRFRPYQSEAWDDRFDDLLAFRKDYGHCSVPYASQQHPTLARWVKRQRYQYKLYQESKKSTMTVQRVLALESIGFAWDAHSASWEERLRELRAYREENGHCNVPTSYVKNKKLATWVKCQRRQYKLMDTEFSTLSPERIATLNQMGFKWELRGAFKTEK